MVKITLILTGLFFSSSFQGTTIHADDGCLPIADAEKILGVPARKTENLTSNKDNVLQYKCTWTASQNTNCNLYYIDEQHSNAEAANKVFDDIVVSNRDHSGQSHPDIGDEAWLHSDGDNFCLLMVRKGNKIMRMKVNKLTKQTSVEEMKRVASEWK